MLIAVRFSIAFLKFKEIITIDFQLAAGKLDAWQIQWKKQKVKNFHKRKKIKWSILNPKCSIHKCFRDLQRLTHNNINENIFSVYMGATENGKGNDTLRVKARPSLRPSRPLGKRTVNSFLSSLTTTLTFFFSRSTS